MENMRNSLKQSDETDIPKDIFTRLYKNIPRKSKNQTSSNLFKVQISPKLYNTFEEKYFSNELEDKLNVNETENDQDIINKTEEAEVKNFLEEKKINEKKSSPNRIKKSETTMNMPVLSISNLSLPSDIFNKNYVNKIKPSSFSKTDVLFCLSVDRTFPDIIYDTIYYRFSTLSKSNKVIFTYVAPPLFEDVNNNYRNKRDTIITSITDKFINIDREKFHFYFEERNVTKYNNHNIEQVAQFAKKFNCSFIFSTFNGLKGPKGDNKELDKALEYFLKNVEIPLILLKELIFKDSPEESKNIKLNWLFVFDMADVKSYSSLNKFIGLVDPYQDFVYGLTLLPQIITKDDVELNFKNEMKIRKIRDFSYEMVNYIKDPHKIVIDLVNFGEVHFNFVVIFNKIKNYSHTTTTSDKHLLPNLMIINSCKSNICVFNGI